MAYGTRLLEVIQGLPLTITQDTCSSLAPYESLPAGITLYVEGLMWEEPDSGPDRVMVFLNMGPDDDSEDLGLYLTEVFEVTNLNDLVELTRPVASASEASTLTA